MIRCYWSFVLVFLCSVFSASAWAVEGTSKLRLQNIVCDSSEDNAVVWLKRAEVELKQDFNADAVTFLKQAARGKIDQEVIKKIRGYLRKKQKLLKMINRAANCSKVDWGNAEEINNPKIDGKGIFDPDAFNDGYIPLALLLELARLEACQSVVDVRDGRLDQAAGCLKTCFFLAHISETASTRHNVMLTMISMAIYKIALNAAQYRFEKLPREQLGRIWEKYVRPDEILKRAKASFAAEAERVEKQCNPKTPLRYNGFINRYITIPFLKYKLRQNIKTQEEFSKKHFSTTLVTIAMLKASQLGLMGIEFQKKYGRRLEKLNDLKIAGANNDDLTDPFGGQWLKMKRVGNKVLIYSIGPDLNDDGGLLDFERKTEKGDIVWRIEKN